MANRKRDKVISIRLTEKELNFIKNKIKKSRLKQREFLMKCVSGKEIIVKENGIEIVKELKSIGNNLNQITRKVNSYEIQDCSPYLNLIYKQISELMKNWQ